MAATLALQTPWCGMAAQLTPEVVVQWLSCNPLVVIQVLFLWNQFALSRPPMTYTPQWALRALRPAVLRLCQHRASMAPGCQPNTQDLSLDIVGQVCNTITPLCILVVQWSCEKQVHAWTVGGLAPEVPELAALAASTLRSSTCYPATEQTREVLLHQVRGWSRSCSMSNPVGCMLCASGARSSGGAWGKASP